MKKTDLKRNMLICKGAEKNLILYRILGIADKIFVMDCRKKVMPMWITIEELEDFVDLIDNG